MKNGRRVKIENNFQLVQKITILRTRKRASKKLHESIRLEKWKQKYEVTEWITKEEKKHVELRYYISTEIKNNYSKSWKGLSFVLRPRACEKRKNFRIRKYKYLKVPKENEEKL